MSGPETERIKKWIIKIFKDLGINITIETNLCSANFLDVTFNLKDGKIYPYRKPNSDP